MSVFIFKFDSFFSATKSIPEFVNKRLEETFLPFLGYFFSQSKIFKELQTVLKTCWKTQHDKWKYNTFVCVDNKV